MFLCVDRAGIGPTTSVMHTWHLLFLLAATFSTCFPSSACVKGAAPTACRLKTTAGGRHGPRAIGKSRHLALRHKRFPPASPPALRSVSPPTQRLDRHSTLTPRGPGDTVQDQV